MNITIKVDQCPESIKESQRIRNEVFVREQGIPSELDLDGRDDKSYHSLACDNNRAVGTARLALTGDNRAVLARVAVLKEYRGAGIASKIVKSLLVQAETLNIKKIDIYPHEYLKGFYESFDFKYIEKAGTAGRHQLIKMEKISHL